MVIMLRKYLRELEEAGYVKRASNPDITQRAFDYLTRAGFPEIVNWEMKIYRNIESFFLENIMIKTPYYEPRCYFVAPIGNSWVPCSDLFYQQCQLSRWIQR
jgi:hypothetical protein